MRLNNSKIVLLGAVLFLIFLSASSARPPYACDSSDPLTNSRPFCDSRLPISQRVQDLVSRLTLDEKISQLINTSPAIPRLNIPAYEWWSEALHGVSSHGKGMKLNGTIRAVTSFPQVILTAASFDDNLWYRIGKVIGKEARAMYNEGQAMGMTLWAPNINIFRDPRWGRGQETPGEDPLVAGTYAVSFVRGIQGDSYEGGQLKDGSLQTSACCKHYTAHDLDNWNDVNRYIFNAHVTQQDLADTYQPPFKSCVERGQASGIMCAYNRINGVPSCADHNLLTRTARGEWSFQGYIVSDCDAVAIIYEQQGYVDKPEDAVVDVLKAGMDLNCGHFLMNYTKSAVEQKKLSEFEIDRALHNLFSIRMRLGLFNGDPKKLQFGNIDASEACKQEHQDLALEAARNGIVLLKNSANLLPLSKNQISLGIIGPNANNYETLLGNYAGYPCKNITILQALQRYVKTMEYERGCNDVKCSDIALDEALDIAQRTDYVVLIMGLDQSQEREKLDRTALVLPGKQEMLIRRVALAAKRPIVLVLLCGGPVDVTFAKTNTKIGSILWAGYPGEAGGIALSDIIFGDHNPGGRLPVTWYPDEFVQVPMTDMRMRPERGHVGRTYRFYNESKVFEFGYGLSYSSYSYEFLSVTHDKLHIDQPLIVASDADKVRYLPVSKMGTALCDSTKFSAIIVARNEGNMPGKHPVLLFVRPALHRPSNPLKQLIGFQTVNIDAGGRVEIQFHINPCEHLSTANKDGALVIEEGQYFLVVADKEYPFSVIV